MKKKLILLVEKFKNGFQPVFLPSFESNFLNKQRLKTFRSIRNVACVL